MHYPPRRVVISTSAALTLGWSLAALVLLYAAGMAALRHIPLALMDTAGPLLTAVVVVLIAAGAGAFSVSGIWVFGGPVLHAFEVWQADRLAHRNRAVGLAAGYTSERRLYLAHGATLALLPAALALLPAALALLFTAPR